MIWPELRDTTYSLLRWDRAPKDVRRRGFLHSLQCCTLFNPQPCLPLLGRPGIDQHQLHSFTAAHFAVHKACVTMLVLPSSSQECVTDTCAAAAHSCEDTCGLLAVDICAPWHLSANICKPWLTQALPEAQAVRNIATGHCMPEARASMSWMRCSMSPVSACSWPLQLACPAQPTQWPQLLQPTSCMHRVMGT